MTDFIVLPGIGGSGEQHWQSLWQRTHPRMRRFEPGNWDLPQLDDWIDALSKSVLAAPTPPVLIAHSLACLLVGHRSARSALPVAGAVLVSVSDPEAPDFPAAEAASFSPAPVGRLRFPTLIVASSDDPYGALPYQHTKAAQWGSQIVEAGKKGHINASSGVGRWVDGLQLLESFAAHVSP